MVAAVEDARAALATAAAKAEGGAAAWRLEVGRTTLARVVIFFLDGACDAFETFTYDSIS